MDIEKYIIKGCDREPEYKLGKDLQKVRELSGKDELIRLGSNENPYGPSPKAVAALKKSAETIQYYTEPSSRLLRQKLCEKLGNGITPDNLAISNGTTHLQDAFTWSFLRPGDVMICYEPSFGYEYYANRTQTDAIVLELDPADYEVDLDAMYNAITDQTKIVWICNPDNPTGVAVNGDQLEAFIKKVPEHVIVVVDEAYLDFADEPAYRSMLPMIHDYNVVVMKTLSKMYGLGGARIGYAVARQELANIIDSNIGVFAMTQSSLDAACAALDDEEYVAMTHAGIAEGRKYLTEEFGKMGWKVYHSQSNFIYADAHMDAMELTDELCSYGIVIRGTFQFPRITVGRMDQNRALVAACREIMKKHGLLPDE